MTTASLVGMLGAPFLSMVVGLVTKSSTPAAVKSWLLVALSIAYAVVEEMITTNNFNLGVAGLKFIAAFMAAVGTHYGFSKPVGVADYLQTKVGLTDPGAHEVGNAGRDGEGP